jgi:hypothetical protein
LRSFTEGKVRLDLFVGLRVQIRQVDGVAHLAGNQVACDDLGDFDPALLLRLVCAGTQVRREHDGGMLAERVFGGQRFGGIHVERDGGHLA